MAALLDLPEIRQLIADLDETCWTGRPGFPVRVMVGAFLIKAVYAIPTWTRTARLIAEHAALREAIGGAPSNWACYRFAAKLRQHEAMLTACTGKALATLREAHPEMGQTIAIDGSDMPAYANGHKHVGNSNGPLRTRYADPDGEWGPGRPFPPGKAAHITATNCTWRYARRPNCRSRGRSGRPANPSRPKCPACWTL
jgi:hypothetical protein